MSTANIFRTASNGASSRGLASARGPFSLLSMILFAFTVRRERLELQGLDDDALKDLGLSRSLAYRESTRSMFDLPSQNPVDRRKHF